MTCASCPLWPLYSAIRAIASPSDPSEPPSASRPAVRRPPAIAPINAAAAGSQSRIESIRPSALQQEVEGDGGDPDQHQPGVDAQYPALRGAHQRRAGAHQPGRAADQHPVDDDPFEGVLREAAKPRARAYDQRVDQLVEVPL